MPTIDADMHVVEPADLWTRAGISEVVGLERHPRDLDVAVHGTILSVPSSQHLPWIAEAVAKQAEAYRVGVERNWDPESQIQAMDREGIDVAVLFPSRATHVMGHDRLGPTLAASVCSTYNQYILEFASQYLGRLYAVGLLTPENLDFSIGEVHRLAKNPTIRGFLMRPNHRNETPWSSASYRPLLTAIAQSGLPLCFHEGGRVLLPQHGALFEPFHQWHVCTHPLAMMVALVDLVGSQVFEALPNLRVAFLEGNCGWLPWLLWRLDEHWEHYGPNQGARPSEVFRSNCFVSMDCDEDISAVVSRGFLGNIVYSTDYPHVDSKYPRSTSILKAMSAEYLTPILTLNPERLYSLA
jgi:predicted TIM-barrel fold metal-dependent hydrolase